MGTEGTAPQQIDDLLGKIISKYRVDRLIGVGGMGHVYQATHPTLGTRVAIKVLSREFCENTGVVQRFLREARAAATLKHQNIVEIYDFDRLPDGRPYMILEFLEGQPLKRKLKREGRLAPGAALSILQPVCSAVGEAHRRGIVHRDLKPDNIYLVDRRGAAGLVKVLDFGIAKVADDQAAAGDATRIGMVLGTPEYMSPEQALGENHRVGPASDIYALGIIAYHMLAGRVPFPGDGMSITRLAMMHAGAPPPPLRIACPELPRSAEMVVLKALAKAPADRWSSAEDFANALSQALDPAQAPAVEHMLEEFVSTQVNGNAVQATVLLPDGKPVSVSTFTGAASQVSQTVPPQRGQGHGRLLAILAGSVAVAVVAVGIVVKTAGHHHASAPTVTVHTTGPAARPATPTPPPVVATPTPPPRAVPASAPAAPTPAVAVVPTPAAAHPAHAQVAQAHHHSTRPATTAPPPAHPTGSSVDTTQDGIGF